MDVSTDINVYDGMISYADATKIAFPLFMQKRN